MIVLLLLLLPLAALAQEAGVEAPAPSLLDSLPALLPPALERLLSYATLLGAGLVVLANLAGNVLARWRAFGRTPPAWLELVVGLLLDAGTDLVALRGRITGAPSQRPPL